MLTAQVMNKVKLFIEKHNFDKGHDLKHVLTVLSHTQKMVLYHTQPKLTSDQIENLNLAALLHDVDDHKFFPENKNFDNARKILFETLPDDWFRIEQIIYLIGMISTSTNGNFISVADDDLWMLYPRFADRLEAIGPIGIERCLQYSTHIGRPLFLPTTPRCRTEQELWKVATPERFQNYLWGEESASFIDHFYDKLLHIGTPEAFGISDNEYLINEASVRHSYVIEYVLDFGRTGTLDL